MNLYLGVGRSMPDGYHAVDTVLHTLALADELVIEQADEFEFFCAEDLGIPPERNLVCRAAQEMAQEFGKQLRFRIELTKRVPHGAGLGGGSSDAAAVIAGLAYLWGFDRLDDRCIAVARRLGSDVPFFLHGGAVRMAGRGDLIVSSLPPLSAPAVLVKPPAGVPTAEAYAAFDSSPQPAGNLESLTAALEAGDIAEVSRLLENNMEKAAIAVVPEVGETLAWTRACEGVLGATVAGSGSAVFAITDTGEAAEMIAGRAAERGWWSRPTFLSASGVTMIEEGDA